MKILVIKTTKGLVPCYDSDYEMYSKIPLNEQFEIDYKKARNPKFHKKYFALMKLAFENQNEFSDRNDMRQEIIIEAGFYTEYGNPFTGEIKRKAKSISFASMDEMEFRELYEKTKDVISKWIGITNQTIEDEIEQYY